MASLLTRVLGSNKGALRGLALACAVTALGPEGCSRRHADKGADARSGDSSTPSDATTPTLANSGSPARSAGDGGDIGARTAPDAPPSAVGIDSSAGDTPFPLDAGKLSLKLDKPIDLGPAGGLVAT